MTDSFVAVDVETANAKYGSICAFGIAVVEDGRVVETVHRIVKPPPALGDFDGRNIGIHGISSRTVRSSPSLASSWSELSGYLDGQVVVCHNAAFDINAIRQAAAAISRQPPNLRYLCTMKVARSTLGLASNRLPAVADVLGVPLGRHHQAVCDAEAAAGIAVALMKRQRVATLRDLSIRSGVPFGRL